MTSKIQIIWYNFAGVIIGRSLTDDEYTAENLEQLGREISGSDGHTGSTEGLNAPDGWDQYDTEPAEVS